MREIKFRAWAKYENTMMPEFHLHPDFGLLLEDERFTTMQYTGLKDKNGKEIYEGDIVKITSDGRYKHEINEPLVVKWEGEELLFNLSLFAIRRLIEKRQEKPTTEFEVIGNIYENPEPLGDVK